MFIGDNKDAHQAATNRLMDVAIYLRKASEALMVVQAMSPTVEKANLGMDRAKIDSMAAKFDVRFQEAAQTYFA